MKKVNACRRCAGLFESGFLKEYCPMCEAILDKKFKVVRDYVRAHKGAGINEVSEVCGTPVKQLIRWIREERLFFAEDSKVALPCLSCGELITYGQYCEPCKHKMMVKLKSVYVGSSGLKNESLKSNEGILLGSNNRLRKIR